MDGSNDIVSKEIGAAPGAQAPLVVHLILALRVGGMENGIVNILNRAAPDWYRHAIVCLEGASDFRKRITRDDVAVYELGKQPGKGFGIYVKVWRLLRRLRPAIVHTRNLPTIDMAVPAMLAGVARRVHGEHGRDVHETHGGNWKYNFLRRLVSPTVDRYIAVSRDLADWLEARVGVPGRKVTHICNGVDCAKFHPPAEPRDALPVPGFADDGEIVIGTVGRIETIKDQLNLAEAFIRLHGLLGADGEKIRLAIIGDGARRDEVAQRIEAAGLSHLLWLPGARDDVPDLLRAMDIFVLPSINEGISNTILEAMACGRCDVATAVGGNPELVADGETGALVPPQDPDALAKALRRYVEKPALIAEHGRAARARAETEFDLEVMVERYLTVYDEVLGN